MENTVEETDEVSLNTAAEIEGFDSQAGKTWIYPTNYPTRDYQYNIIQKALLTNTLVSLPTGLGKTFIAAVVMYNIYRWYPHGKIIFMAPTKPLVKQQVDACYDIMAIPPEVTAELTGAKASSARANIWTEKRVFYVTPQVLQNDLNKIAELGSKIKCLVFDEAHRAKGNHAYCEVIRRLLAQNHKYFRVLALSATPGSTVNDVLEIIQNLLISHVEFRTEESIDVAPYVFQRSLETIVVPLDQKLEEVKNDYYKILEPFVKTLIRFNIVQGNCGSLTKGKIFMLMKNFQDKNRGTGSSNYSEIMRCLNICVTLYHALELLIRHGLRNFLSFYDEHIEKPLLRGNTQLRSIINNVREYLGPIPNIEVLPDGTYPEIPQNIKFGHPKYYKLREVLVSHFSQSDKSNTRVIVFFEYRESVMEAHTLLLQSRPLIQPKIFLGQGSGITQKMQLGVVKAFREGRCNTLLSTCIGEEGLDVGEVDLIICFDISNKSPIRMVQRMGRTGRKREGRIVVLVTEGREQQTLKDCLIHKNNISTYVLESKQLSTGLYPDSPRLVSKDVTPRCEKMFITVRTVVKKKSVKDMLKSLSNNSSEPAFSQEVKILNIKERIPRATMFFNRGLNAYKEKSVEENSLFYKFIEKQRASQKTHKVKNSKYTKIFTDLLCLADSKRFNLPTQVQCQGHASKNLKQSDIRNMFVKKNSQLDFQPTQTRTEILEDIPTQILVKEVDEYADGLGDLTNIPKEVFTLISNFLFAQMANPLKECRHCPRGFRCEDFTISSAPSILTNNNWVPSEDILDTVSLTDLENFTNFLDPTCQDSLMQLDESNFTQMMDNYDCQILDTVNFTQLEKEAEIISENVVAETEKSFNFEAPKTYSNLLSKFGDSIFISQDITQVKKDTDSESNKESFNISEKSLLEFFKLESLTDIYGNSSPNSSQQTVIYSQNLSDFETSGNSLCPRLKSPSPSDQKHITRKTVATHNEMSDDITEDLNKTKTEVDINDFCDLSSFGIIDNSVEDLNKSKFADIEQICDLSQFGILPKDKKKLIKQNADLLEAENEDLNKSKFADIEQICDLSQFGILPKDKKKLIKQNADLLEAEKEDLNKSKFADIEQICDLSQFGILPKDKKKLIKQNADLLEAEKEDLNKSKFADIEQICDLSQFGILPKDKKKLIKQNADLLEAEKEDLNKSNFADIEQICDLSQFGISLKDKKKLIKPNADVSEAKKEDLNKSQITNIEDICDLSQFGIFPANERQQIEQEADGLSKKAINDIKLNLDENKSDNNIFSQDDLFQLSQGVSNKEHFSGNSNFSCDKLYKKSSTPRKNRHNEPYGNLNYQTATPPSTSPVKDIKNTVDDADFNLPTQRTSKFVINGSTFNNTQRNKEFGGVAITGQSNNLNKSNIATRKITKNVVNSVKTTKSVTQQSNFIEDYEDDEVFTIATQPFNYRTNILTAMNLKADNDVGVDVNTNFTKPKPQISKKYETTSKFNCTQKSGIIEDCDESEDFVIATQPTNLNKANILTTKNSMCVNKDNVNFSPVEEEIDCIDLTLSPTPTNEKRILSCESQIPITQMLSLLNKASQKENSQKENIRADTSFATLTPKVHSPILNKGRSTWMSKLSTNKNRDKKGNSSNMQSKSAPKKYVDPYLFSINIKSNIIKPIDKGSTSSDEFEDSVFLKPGISSRKPEKKLSVRSRKGQNKRSKKKSNNFLDLEAQLSENESVSEDENEENMDYYEKSFVNDETQNFNTQMHAKYLQSVRSPAIPGRFKIPVRPTTNIADVYSQPDFTEADTYLEDSFCVDTDDNELTQQEELSQLEILEKKLREKKKRKKSQENDVSKPKRRRVIRFDSDDSD